MGAGWWIPKRGGERQPALVSRAVRWGTARVAALDSRIRAIAGRHATVRLLMTASGVGAIARRTSPREAKVALARKLAVILHAMWRAISPVRETASD